jgi:hypothetical protein
MEDRSLPTESPLHTQSQSVLENNWEESEVEQVNNSGTEEKRLEICDDEGARDAGSIDDRDDEIDIEGANGADGEIGNGMEAGIWARQSVKLNRIAAEQSEILGDRNRPDTWRRISRLARPLVVEKIGMSEDGEAEGGIDEDQEDGSNFPVSPVSRWERYLRMLPKDFLNSAEAMMQAPCDSTAATSLAEKEGVEDEISSVLDGTRRRCAPYAGLALCHYPENCPDLLYVYEQVYEIKIRRGGRKEGYQQFRGVVGQLARFAVAVEVAPAEIFAQEGGLFQLATSSKLVRAFIGGFQSNAQASTVYSKATLLGLFCRMAKQHFGKITSVETAAVLSRIDETTNLLGGFRRVEKATSRRQTAVRRDQDRRETFIRSEDWYLLQRRIEQDMASVWSGVCRLLDRFGEDAHSYMDENHSLVRKYSLLLVIYILLTGGGQRPQVYASLQHPPESVLRRWEHEESEIEEEEAEATSQGAEDRNTSREIHAGRAVKLYPLQEKTPRGTFCPGIIFSDTARSFFVAYARIIRPAIMRGVEKVNADALNRDRTFLVHTETGHALTGENLRNTLRFYLAGIGGLRGDLSRVTVMTLRASYASVMFTSFRRGKFPGVTAEQFLADLSETMNTSTEMLRTTYIATNGSEFDEAASAFLRASREE